MSPRRHWRDAASAAVWLGQREAARRTLLLLAQLPLAPVNTIERLAGLRGSASVYHSLQQLREAGLIAAIRPPLRPGFAPQLLYLTDLGLAAVGLDQGVDPEQLAQRKGLRADDLLALLPGLPCLVALYSLLAALANSQPGPPNLLAWQRPWRQRYLRPTAKAPVSVTLPAYAAFAWEHAAGAYLLQPDLGGVPLRAYRPALDHLLVLRSQESFAFPTLVIATTGGGRADGWRALLEDVRRTRSERPLTACVAAWDDLPGGLRGLGSGQDDPQPTYHHLVRQLQVRSLRPRGSAQPLPALVGEAFPKVAASPRATEAAGNVLLCLAEGDRTVLDLLGRHPFLTAEGLAALDGWQVTWARRRLRRLIAWGLARRLEAREVGAAAAERELVELTAAGLAVVAAQHGFSLALAVRYLGLAGGGPDHAVGARRQLAANLAHTVGADGIFLRLAVLARNAAATRNQDALLEWQNAAACGRGHVRPDGYGIYQQGGQRYGFFVEYDRGTMGAHDYVRKFDAYYEYLAGQRFAREYDGFPTILMVTSDNAAEERIARAAQASAVGRGVRLPLLLTCEWRIDDERNHGGLLGPIWREPHGRSADRRAWLIEPGRATPADRSVSRNAVPIAPCATRSGKTQARVVWGSGAGGHLDNSFPDQSPDEDLRQ